MRRFWGVLLALALLLPGAGIAGEAAETGDPAPGVETTVDKTLNLWKSVSGSLEVHPGVLPDGLPDTEELCIVALGFQLNRDGSMREELIGRLQVTLACAEKYPRAYIACTGGPTAAEDPAATEAERMASWLEEHGVAGDRLIVENRSLTTAQNAAYTCQILADRYPEITQIAIISSDYHIPTGVMLFEAEAEKRQAKGEQVPRVVSNAAYGTSGGGASSLMESLKSVMETYYGIYSGE